MTAKSFFARALAALAIVALISSGAAAKEKAKTFTDILNEPALDGAVTALLIRDLKTGKMLYSQNSGEVMIPASNMKVVTAAGAILALGPGYRFHTDFYVKNFDSSKGFSTGLYVKGYGDPTMKEEFYEKASHGMDLLVESLKGAGLKKVEGVLWLDDSFFENTNRPESWEQEDMSWCYAPRPGALAAGGNCLQGKVTGASRYGYPATAELDPALDPSMVEMAVRTVSKGSAKISISQDSVTGKITISGSIPINKSAEIEYTAAHPAFMYGAALIAALKRAGIETNLVVKMRKDAPPGYEFLDRYESLPLREVLAEMGHESDNFVAEQVVRVVGALRGGGGTHQKGLAVITGLLGNYKISDGGSLTMIDGSGLSRLNRLKPEVLLTLLSAFYNSEFKDDMLEVLARPGEQGTLKKRVPEAKGRLWGKTGALRGVCSMSGYITRKNGEMAAYVMVMNGYKVHSNEIRKLQDEIIKVMLEM